MRKSHLLGILLVAACASEGDIDRTQPNKLPKSLFQGTWYVRSTVIDVPPTSTASFVGEQGGARWANVEKIVWEIQEQYLIAWRAYEEIPGTNPSVDPSTSSIFDTNPRDGQGPARNPGDYHDNPVAVFPITHFDIKRQYNAATGEQNNVIYEDTTDRNWYERDYVRVDWASEQVTSDDFLTKTLQAQLQYYVQQNEGGSEAFRMFTKDGSGNDVRVSFEDPRNQPDASQVYYFDMVGNLFMEPAEITVNQGTPYEWKASACILGQYYPLYFPQAAQVSCGPTNVKVRTSFLKVGPERLTYEPQVMGDRDLSKFGFFRTERLTYDRQRGLTESGRIYLADRHNIWQESWQKNDDGSYMLDDMGRRMPLATADRVPKPIVYQLSPNYPVEMIPVTEKIASEWNRAFRRTVAVAKGLMTDNSVDVNTIPRDQVPDMFVLGYNGWQKDASGQWLYDASKRVAELGDLRYNFIAWVAQDQITGPLGFGPHGSDPETGEIIQGTANVYGAAVDRLATYTLDIIRLLNGDLAVNDIIDGTVVRDWINRNRNPVDPSRISPELAGMTVDQVKAAMLHGGKAELLDSLRQRSPDQPITGLQEVSPYWAENQGDRLRGTKFEDMLVDSEASELVPAFAAEPVEQSQLDPSQIDAQTRSQISPLNWMEVFTKAEPARWDRASKRTLWLAEFSDTATLGLARQFQGRTDYDNVWQELREHIYEGVMEHELGHTLGLRHNFAGSYDSINYFDRYWDLREENLAHEDLGRQGLDFHDFLTKVINQAAITPNQIAGRMTEYSYSTVMDYSSRFYVEDIHGIGKYDEAAILFGYGQYVEAFDVPRYISDQQSSICARFPQNDICGNASAVHDASLVAESQMKDILWERLSNCRSRFESQTNAASEYITEGSNFHYTQLPHLLFGFQDMIGEPNKAEMGYRFRKFVPWGTQRAALDAEEASCNDLIRQDPTVNVDNYVQHSDLDERGLSTDRAIEVPYAFCSDELVGINFSCFRWDEGADNWEQVNDKINNYEDYYFFTHYKRDRVQFTPSTTFNYVSNRIFNYFTDWYQRWLLSESTYPDTKDQTLSMIQYFATYAGFNELARAMSRPFYGKYAFNADLGEWVMSDADPETPVQDSEFLIPRGEGRGDFSLYDGDSGYYFFNRIQEVGSFWDYLAGIVATAVRVTARSVASASADARTYLIPYNLVFKDELNNLYDGLFLQEYDKYAPRIVNGHVEYPPAAFARLNFTDGHAEDFDPGTWAPPVAADGYPVRLGYLQRNSVDSTGQFGPGPRADRYGTQFSRQIYALLYGSVFFQSAYQLDYNYRNMIFRPGSGEDIIPGPPFQTVECADPISGIRYAAIWNTTDSATKATPAVRMVERCQMEADRYALVRQACDSLDSGPRNDCFAARNDVTDAVEKLEIQRSLYHFFQYNF
jgi:uncharacterized protein DUF4953